MYDIRAVAAGNSSQHLLLGLRRQNLNLDLILAGVKIIDYRLKCLGLTAAPHMPHTDHRRRAGIFLFLTAV